LYLLPGCSRESSPTKTPIAPNKTPVEVSLADAEKLFRQREDVERLREARQLTARLRDSESRNFEVEWKFAKYSLFLGQMLSDESEKEKIFTEGRDAGKIASRIAVDKPDGYFWYGANQAELARLSPVTVGYASIDDIREAMNKVIEIDPGYQGASEYDVLAQIELNTRLLFGGKATKAVSYLEAALAIEKENSNIRLHLAQAYLDVDNTQAAKEQLQLIIKMQPDPDYIPEHKRNVAEAKRLLQTRF
jgi:tetratricopeptide (TPR) repeat protein